MMKKTLLASMLAVVILGPVSVLAEDAAEDNTEAALEADQQGKVKVETIRLEGSQGAIQEERVQAMRSEIRYMPNGNDGGYLLTGSEGTTLNAHKNDDVLIPSWNLFSW